MRNTVNKATNNLFLSVITCVLATLLLSGCAWEQANEYPTCTLMVVASPPDKGTVTGAGVYPVGTTVTLTAIPNAGHFFSNWSDNEWRSSREVFIIKTKQTYTAYFY